jgi:hypothetical protein
VRRNSAFKIRIQKSSRRKAMFGTALVRSLGITILAAVLAVPFAAPVRGDAPPVRVRGTIERIDGPIYVVKARDGAELKLTLADNPQIAGVTKASLADVKQGSFVGVTAMPQPDGGFSAVEVHIFPEAMRGTGEGHYPWDLQPQSTMTNANVEQVVSAVDGRTLTLKYKDGEKKITVSANTPIVTYVPGRQERDQAGRQSVHCRGQAGRWNAARPRLARRPRRRDAADVIAAARVVRLTAAGTRPSFAKASEGILLR